MRLNVIPVAARGNPPAADFFVPEACCNSLSKVVLGQEEREMRGAKRDTGAERFETAIESNPDRRCTGLGQLDSKCNNVRPKQPEDND